MPTKGNVLKKIKAIYEKPTANITINRENRKLFPLRYGTRQESHSYHFYSPQYQNDQKEQSSKKKIKRLQIRRKVKLYLFVDGMIQCVDNHKTPLKLLELMNEFSKVAGCKVIISCISLCQQHSSKKEIKKTILFMIASIKE